MYKVSIIIPHYNSLDTLNRLLASIPLWDISLQVIIVDDKSKANQFEELETRYGGEYFNLSILQNDTEKKGAGVCRNIGLDYAKGDWVLFADGDDYFVPMFYETVKSYVESTADVVYFSPESLEEDGKEPSKRHEQYEVLIKNYLKEPNDTNELMLRYKFYVPWSKLYRREFLVENQIQFDETSVANDVMFSVKTGYHMNSFEVTDERIYCWMQKKGTLTTLINEEAYDTRLAVYINYCQFLFERLNEKQVKLLDLTGRGYLVTGIKHQFGLLKILKIGYVLQKNHIGIFDRKYMNPMFVIQRIRFNYGVYKNEKKFYSK